ncbi:hypothetical protein CDAR_517481 [Caerostris darwini]|uniref:Uncharacterized protein n=1 Tax=Caerostris darwini TaxID=1538125 RepID=A0AAV4PNU4_9ARAC|nr:hypothetical protein CDAR_517481 [Caerostris darwini]
MVFPLNELEFQNAVCFRVAKRPTCAMSSICGTSNCLWQDEGCAEVRQLRHMTDVTPAASSSLASLCAGGNNFVLCRNTAVNLRLLTLHETSETIQIIVMHFFFLEHGISQVIKQFSEKKNVMCS